MLEQIYENIAPLWGNGTLEGNAKLGCEIMSHLILWLLFAGILWLCLALFRLARGK